MLTEKTREDGFTINATGWKRGAYVLRVRWLILQMVKNIKSKLLCSV